MRCRFFALLTVVFSLIFSISLHAQTPKDISVIAYYAGKRLTEVDSIPAEKLTHIIFSFCHLKDARLYVSNAVDSGVIQQLVLLKKRNKEVKVLLSLGGWSGCSTCSDIFSSKKDRKQFSASVKELSEYFQTDGIDLDWEYPAIAGFPGHKYQPEDKHNFTLLVKQLRKTMGKEKVISFAAGGFNKYISESIEWKKVMKKVDLVNLMTYDLVSGYSVTTGHHTALYSSPQQPESIDNAVTRLLQLKVPKQKIIIGAAFYGRVWEAVPDSNMGLYQSGKFKTGVDFKNIASKYSLDSGFIYHWDETVMAPYLYNSSQSLFVTYDDKRSIELKIKYAIEKGLGGIMFWELSNDQYEDGLLDVINRIKLGYLKQ
ncbi:MAG TPA: glycoside hydrolase family 18 protein [Flavisolibacter sp.]|nr:glycoside hydrolase family 18 protein [Flavisolibacter sp.]